MAGEMTARRLGDHVPCSIGTARAIESLFGIGDDFPEPRHKHIDQLWVSLRTLVRNAYEAYSTEERKFILDDTLVEDVMLDINVIESMVSSRSDGRIELVVYLCSYSSLSKKYPMAKIRQANTELQKGRLLIENAALNEIMQSSHNFDLRSFDIDFTGSTAPRSAMITHLPVDLLNQYHFKSLYLLESHSGGFKNRLEWHTRLFGIGGESSHIPFNKAMLQLFGDSNMFSPMPIKLRRYIIDLATRRKWTPNTSKDYIMKCIEDERDPTLEALMYRLW